MRKVTCPGPCVLVVSVAEFRVLFTSVCEPFTVTSVELLVPALTVAEPDKVTPMLPLVDVNCAVTTSPLVKYCTWLVPRPMFVALFGDTVTEPVAKTRALHE